MNGKRWSWKRRGNARPMAATTTVRTTRQGEIVGFVAENGAHVWRGLPYAASTAGGNRWRPPQPPPSWEVRRGALDFADRCAQLTNRGDADEGVEPGIVVGSEDCLALDVYAPADAEGRALPVMAWIHGGGNVWGRSGLYDGSRLAVNEQVIIVAVQYRLGPLGWFAHQALRNEAPDEHEGAACFATLDLIASLQWVADNIASFGGDPDCVTIFGESSGGHNVVTLLASPLAAGLFHRAIIESGSFDSVSLGEAEGLDGDLPNTASEIARKLGAATSDDLRAASLSELFAACAAGDGWFLDVPRVIQDGVVLPVAPLRDSFASTATFNEVPIITGTNRDEMKLFYFADEKTTKKRFGLLVEARDQRFYDALTHYVSRVWRIRAVDEPAATLAAAGHDDMYAYRFDWDDGGRFLSMDFKKLLGAAHGFQSPFVFNRFEHLGDADRVLFQRRTEGDRQQLSRAIGAYWATFARTGRPSCSGRPDWPQYVEEGGSYLCLDTDNDGGIRVVNDSDDLRRVAADLREDERLDDAERRAIIDELDRWMFARPVQATLRSATGLA